MVTNRAIQTSMEKEGSNLNIAFICERMDVSVLPEKSYFQDLNDAYRKKYADQTIDLIFAVNYRALKFLIIHGEEIWPNVPIIFTGVEVGRREQFKTLRPNITGLYGDARFGDMLSTVFKIHPKTKQITVVVGSSRTERFIENKVRQSYAKFDDRADFFYLSDISFDSMLSKVVSQPPNSIVMFLTLIKDGKGKPVPENALHLISRLSSVPVYGLFDVYVGHGTVGGTVYSIENRGAEAGNLGLRILTGEKPKDIAPETSQRHFNLYDWRQLQRWGIAEDNLPHGSIVRFRTLTFYEAYKWYIWGCLLLVLLEAVLIIHLLLNRYRRLQAESELQRAHYELKDMITELKYEITERKQTEKELKESEHYLKRIMASRILLQEEVKHMGRVTTMGTITAAIAHEINQPLGAILSNAQAAIRFLKAEHPNIRHVREALEDIVSDDKYAAIVIQRLRMMLKKEELKREVLQINSNIKDIIDLLQSEIIINNALIECDFEKKLDAIYGDRVQIQQVVLNLLVNALDAVKNEPVANRKIYISTRIEKSSRILVSVVDSGPGIEPHDLENIFEAFYTTKKKGLGMGLPISKTIIEQHNGCIWASNNPEGGAVFAFTLPIENDDKHEHG